MELIAQKGFNELCIEVPTNAIRIISKESSGLPIITQQACGQLFIDKQLEEVMRNSIITFTNQEAHDALHHVATTRYKQFESWYLRLTEGPRRLARKYNTYELVLSAFTLDPLKFELKRSEIDERLNKLAATFQKPPTASVNSTLSALKKFQNNNGFELLEWSKRDQVIYVIEPAFLFFLRWRKKRSNTPKLMDVIHEFLKVMSPK